MWQNGVAARRPQRNELISPRFQWAFLFISEKAMTGWSRSIPSKANARRLRRDYKVFQSQWCFRSERAFFGLVENRLLFRTPNGTSGKVDRALGTIANDANPGVSQVKARSARRSTNSRPVCFVRNRTLSRRMCKTKKSYASPSTRIPPEAENASCPGFHRLAKAGRAQNRTSQTAEGTEGNRHWCQLRHRSLNCAGARPCRRGCLHQLCRRRRQSAGHGR